MKNKKSVFLLEKFKGFVFGFVFAAALVAVGVYAANTDAVQKKWKAVWHGTDWIDAGRVVRSEELAENLEWLKQRIDNLESGSQGGSWEYLTVHSQSTSTPACPDGWEKVSEGYSYITSYLSEWNGGILSLSSPQSCVTNIIPLRTIRCYYGGCDYMLWGDFSLYLAIANLQNTGAVTSMTQLQNMISRCSICRKKGAKVITFHSMTNTPPSCPAGGKLLWTGYSLNSMRPNSEFTTDLTSPGSCLKEFKDMPFIECRYNLCDYVTPGDYASYLTATTTNTGHIPTQQAEQYISRCAVCEF